MSITDEEYVWSWSHDECGNEVKVKIKNRLYVKPSSPSKMKFYKR